MFDTLEERVTHWQKTAYALQFTNGTHDAYESLIRDTHPTPLVEVDCADIDDWDDFIAILADDLTTHPDDYFSNHYFINDHFLSEGGALVLYNFHELDSSTASDLAMYIKGLWEDINFDTLKDFAIAVTTDDPGALLLGNGDLSGRVRTIDLDADN